MAVTCTLVLSAAVVSATFAGLGVPLRAFGVCNTESKLGVPYTSYPPVWLGRGRYDWKPLDDQVDDFLKASPAARFICMVDLNTPRWLARELLQRAGAHLWTDEPLAVVANRRFLSVHVKAGGRKRVHLPRRCRKVVELLTDRVVAENVETFEYAFRSPDTALFELLDE